jgi:predicted dehydrogenase
MKTGNGKVVRAAMVGLGSWGQTLVNSVQGKCDEIRFTAAHTRTPAKAEDFCSQHGMRLAPSFEALLEDDAIDAVVLATPNSQHEAQIKLAAAAGKHVFAEKPVALERRGVESAIRATVEAGVVLGVGFNRRFHPSIRELRARVKQGRLGAIGSIIAELTATTGLYRPADTWRVDPAEEPAGAMASIGVHLVDAMIDIIGRISEVHCVVEQRAAPHCADTTSLLLKFENGVTGLAFCSLAAARNFRLAVYGAEGFAEVVTPTMDVFRFIPAVQGRASHLARIPDPEEITTPHFNSTTEELAQFAKAILTGEPYPVPLDDVMHGACVFDAAVESARIKAPVKVPS